MRSKFSLTKDLMSLSLEASAGCSVGISTFNDAGCTKEFILVSVDTPHSRKEGRTGVIIFPYLESVTTVTR